MNHLLQLFGGEVGGQLGAGGNEDGTFHVLEIGRTLRHTRVELCGIARSKFSHYILQFGSLTFNSRLLILMASMGSLTSSPVPVCAPYLP